MAAETEPMEAATVQTNSHYDPARQQLEPMEKPASQVPSPPPDGGLIAWLQVMCSFWLWFVVWGLVNSFGVFQAYYETDILHSRSSSDISWIGSLQLCIFLLGTVLVGPVFDMGYLRELLLVGSFLTVFGMMMTSLCREYYQFILAQGICTGLGMTCLFTPSIALVPQYFVRKRALASGIGAAGSSVGAVIIAIIFQQLVPKVGFGWATRVIAFMLLVTLIPPILVARRRVQSTTARSLVDKTALKDLPFFFYGGTMFFAFLGLYVPFFYVQVYSEARHVLQGQDTYLNAYLVILLNVGSLLGRLFPNIVADYIGPMNTQIPCTIICGILSFCWISVMDKGGLVTFAILYGFFSGAFVSLTAVIWASLSPNIKLLGTRSGMIIIPQAAGVLIGNPIAGALIKGTNFTPLQVWAGATVFAAVFCAVLSRFAKTGLRITAKA